MDALLKKACIDFTDKLGFYLGRKFSAPFTPAEHVYFSLTNRCNLSCQMCEISRNPSRKEDELSTAQIKDIILQIKDMGIRHVIFSGGEPLLREDLLEIVEFATAQGLAMVDIITNGALLDDSIIEKLIRARVNHITISLDGMGEVNDLIRGSGVFEKAARNIDKVNFYKAKHHSSSPSVGINFTVMDKNIDDILPMVSFARSKGCNIVVFQPILFNNTKMYEKKTNALWVSRPHIVKLKKIIARVIELKYSLDDLYIYTDTQVLKALPGYFRGKRPKGNFKCYEGIKRIVITCSGTLWSCLGLYGDLRTQRLKEAWFSAEMSRLRKESKRCKEHCLQDCVYFPSDIHREFAGVLDRIRGASRQEKEQLREILLSRIDGYARILSGKADTQSPGLFQRIKLLYELNRLRGMRSKVSGIKSLASDNLL